MPARVLAFRAAVKKPRATPAPRLALVPAPPPPPRQADPCAGSTWRQSTQDLLDASLALAIAHRHQGQALPLPERAVSERAADLFDRLRIRPPGAAMRSAADILPERRCPLCRLRLALPGRLACDVCSES